MFNYRYIAGIAFVSAMGGYLFGFDFAVISGALPFLRSQFHLTAAWEGFLTGSLALGCIAGSLLAGYLADRKGRKPGLMVASLVFAVTSLAMGLSPSLPFFLVMRFLAGVGVGMASILSPMYIAEISPAASRGKNVAIYQLTLVLGILITNLINYLLAGQGPDAWRWMFGLGVLPSLLFFAGVLWLPESPRWLVKANKKEAAIKVLRKIGNDTFVQSTLNSVVSSLSGAAKIPFKAIFNKPTRYVVLTGIALAVFQQLCGINIVFNYTSTIFASVGANVNRQLLETVLIGFVNLAFTLLAMWQVDRLGRRPLMIAGALGLCVLYIVLSIALKERWNPGWVSILVLFSIATYATSLAPVTWVLIAEIFPNNIRGTATSVAVASLWGAYFILVFTFPILAEKLGTYGPFYLYAAICFLGFLFCMKNIKETKGKSLEELEDIMVSH